MASSKRSGESKSLTLTPFPCLIGRPATPLRRTLEEDELSKTWAGSHISWELEWIPILHNCRSCEYQAWRMKSNVGILFLLRHLAKLRA
jgi:hypothetical protein